MKDAPLAIVALVGRTLEVSWRSLPSLAALVPLVLAPVWAVDLATTAALGAASQVPVVAVVALWLALVVLQLGAATALALQRLRGERSSLAAGLRAGTRRLVPAAVALGASTAAVLAGLVVLTVPGLVAFASLAVVLPVAVDERGGPARALARSLDLTRGQRGRVFTALGVVLALTGVLVLFLWAGAGILGDQLGEDALGLGVIASTQLVLPLPAIGAAVAYETLRGAKEGPREAELERVFG